MKKFIKKVLVVIFCFLIVFTGLPFDVSNIFKIDDLLSVKANAIDLDTYDLVEFGSYPQSRVTDDKTINALKNLSLDWISYGYYSGNGEEGSMAQSDFMKFADVEYNGDYYRAVLFTSYRPSATFYTSDEANSSQSVNGYSINTVYWFKFEPLVWRVLNAEEGLVMSEALIDSQSFNNTVYIQEDENSENYYNYYADEDCTVLASNYESSSIRAWLNDDFYNTAFSPSDKSKIYNSKLENRSVNEDCFELDENTIYDKVFLLSYFDLINPNYGFSDNPETSISTFDSARSAIRQSDYAISQGLKLFNSETYSFSEPWLTRTSKDCYGDIYRVHINSRLVTANSANSSIGVRPAMKINLNDLIKVGRFETFEAKKNIQDHPATSREEIIEGVYVPPQNIMVSIWIKNGFSSYGTSNHIDIGERFALKAKAMDMNTGDVDESPNVIGWKSSNTNVATVNRNGVVTGVSRGYTYISAEIEGGAEKTYPFYIYVGDYIPTGREDLPKYTITFYNNYGSNSAYCIRKVYMGNSLWEPSEPTRKGYVFMGWYENSSCTGDRWFSELNSKCESINNNVSLYAKWQKVNNDAEAVAYSYMQSYFEEHLEFTKTDNSYNKVRNCSFAQLMVSLKDTAEFKWDRFIEFDYFTNYYDIVLSDFILSQASNTYINEISRSYGAKSYLELGAQFVESFSKFLNEYGSEFNFSNKDTQEMVNSLEYIFKNYNSYTELKKACSTRTYQLFSKVFDSNSGKKFFISFCHTYDASTKTIDFLDTGISIANNFCKFFNYMSAVDAFLAYTDAQKAIFKETALEARSSNLSIYDAMMRFVNADLSEENYNDLYSSYLLGTNVKSAAQIFSYMFKDALIKYFGNIIGSVLVKQTITIGGKTFKAGSTFASVLSGVANGYFLGKGISKIICSTGELTETMQKCVAIGEIAEFSKKVLLKYENQLIYNSNYTNAELFDSAFHLYKGIQIYSTECTVEALKTKRNSIAVQVFAKGKDYDTVISDTIQIKYNINSIECHDSVINGSLEMSKTIDKIKKSIVVHCPVDVYVYNSNGEEVVRIINDIVEYADDSIVAFVAYEGKYIFFSAEDNYGIKIISTDTGEMSYKVFEYSETGITREITYADTALVSDMAFDGSIDMSNNLSADNYALSFEETTISCENDKCFPVSISICTSQLQLVENEIFQLEVSAFPENSCNMSVSWTSDNTDVISVDNNGMIKAIDSGTAIITASTANNVFATCQVFVVAFDGAEYTDFDCEQIEEGNSVKITRYFGNEEDVVIPKTIGGLPVVALDENIFDECSHTINSITIKENVVSFPDILINDISTKICCFANSTAHVYAQEKELSYELMKTINMSIKEMNLSSGLSARISLEITPVDATADDLKWCSSDTNVVEVSNKGVVYGKKEGQAIISFYSEDGRYVDSCMVNVKCNKPTKISISSPSKRTINYGESIKLYANTANLPYGYSIEWKVEGTGVSIKPSSSGKICTVTSTSTGNVVIKAFIVDSNGKVVTDENGKYLFDSEYLYSDANLWLRIVYFFKQLFRISLTTSQLFNVIL